MASVTAAARLSSKISLAVSSTTLATSIPSSLSVGATARRLARTTGSMSGRGSWTVTRRPWPRNRAVHEAPISPPPMTATALYCSPLLSCMSWSLPGGDHPWWIGGAPLCDVDLPSCEHARQPCQTELTPARAKGRRGCAPGIPPLRCHETGSRRQAVPCRQRQLRLSPLYALRTLPRTTTINVKSNPEPHADSRQVHPVDSSFRRSAEAMRDQDGISRQFSLGYDSARVAVGGTRRTADARRDCKEAVSAAQIVSAQAAGSYLEAAIWPESGDAWSLRRAERPGDARDNRPDRRGSQPRRTSPSGGAGADAA